MNDRMFFRRCNLGAVLHKGIVGAVVHSKQVFLGFYVNSFFQSSMDPYVNSSCTHKKTRRERLKSALYLRLKKRKTLSKNVA